MSFFPGQLRMPSLPAHLTELCTGEQAAAVGGAEAFAEDLQGLSPGPRRAAALQPVARSLLSAFTVSGLPFEGVLCTEHSPPGTEGHPQHLQASQASSGCKRSVGQLAAL